MAAPRKMIGTLSPLSRPKPVGGGVATTSGGRGGRPTTSGGRGGKTTTSGASKGGKKKKGGKKNFNYNIAPLNPPFDPRMRQIGNPLHNSKAMKRGWVQTTEDNLRVNFLFNPSQLDLNHGVNTDLARNPDYTPNDDVMDITYASMGSTLGVKLLYDRTYELVGNSSANFATRYGVFADVAAWYVLLGMLPEMPGDWKDSMIVAPATIKQAYLFLGLRMVFYGWLTSIAVTYTHWNQQMVPVRCSVDLQMELLPHTRTSLPVPGKYNDAEIGKGLTEDWLSAQVPDFGV
jgi:hypothetical protein